LLRRTCVYLQHIAALFRLGKAAAVHESDRNKPGDLASWSDDDLRLLVDEGRRQLDRQNADLEQIRGRAQVLLAIGIALEGTSGALREEVSKGSSWFLALWVLALVLIGFSVLGAAAVAVVRYDGEMIHTTVLSRYTPPVLRRLADDYAAIAPTNESQLATRLINMRFAVVLLLAGALCTLAAWIGANSSAPGRPAKQATPVAYSTGPVRTKPGAPAGPRPDAAHT
jgi:hypothetical protein